MRYRTNLLVGSVSAVIIVACSSDLGSIHAGATDGSAGESADVASFNLSSDGGGGTSGESCRKIDLVFVIDNSASMGEEQGNLISNFPKFVDVINTFKAKDGSDIDYRIAVTTTDRDVTYQRVNQDGKTTPQTDKGSNGAFMTTTGMKNPWLERSDKNVASMFSTIANVGLKGSAIEMPLEGSRLALDARLKDSNAGFLRSDALLGLVYMTDEDDCSRLDNNFRASPTQSCTEVAQVPIDEYVSFFDKLKGDRSRWATAVIAGASACHSSFGSAIEATRLKDFTKKLGTSAVFSSICEGDLSKALEEALNTFDVACKNFVPPQ